MKEQIEARNSTYIPHRWGRKIIELRHMILIAIPIGILSGAGVSLIEYICNILLWVSLGLLSKPPGKRQELIART